jgi:hypothetical protein
MVEEEGGESLRGVAAIKTGVSVESVGEGGTSEAGDSAPAVVRRRSSCEAVARGELWWARYMSCHASSEGWSRRREGQSSVVVREEVGAVLGRADPIRR